MSSMPDNHESVPVADLVNWNLQKKKLWRGKGHAPSHVEIRAVAEAAITDGLKTWSLDDLASLIESPCREANLKGARERRDKALQLKREYFNTATELLEQAIKKRAERCELTEKERKMEEEIREMTQEMDGLHPRPEGEVGRQGNGLHQETETRVKMARENAEIPQQTCFYASLLMGLTQAVRALPEESIELSSLTEQNGTGLDGWVDVKAETELGSGWVDVKSQCSTKSSVVL
ncbi:hypothetical protein MFIFM68171_08324 [Madurella fahalii]|uniref:Uncharacterized protein n=1 Tax=Madurella fahalii TaxID=1157608 RepID=A0ABQ0GK37_9PEZI